MVEEGNCIFGEKKYAALGSVWKPGRRRVRGTEEKRTPTKVLLVELKQRTTLQSTNSED